MEKLYQQTLAALPVEDVSFILSQFPQAAVPSRQAVADTDAVMEAEPSEEDEESRRRRRIEREWPDVGTVLRAEYYGTTYTAEVIVASKKLKSGKQIHITSGPAQRTVCDSLSEAMIAATEKQRTDQNLGRKGVSNGWLFWIWDGKPENIAGAAADEADED